MAALIWWIVMVPAMVLGLVGVGVAKTRRYRLAKRLLIPANLMLVAGILIAIYLDRTQ